MCDTTDCTECGKARWDDDILPSGICIWCAKKPRKVVQILHTIGPETVRYQGNQMMHALCDDGSMWELFMYSESAEWQRLPDIPQGDAS